MGVLARLAFALGLVLAHPHTLATQLARTKASACDDVNGGGATEDLGRVAIITPSLYAVEVGVNNPKNLYCFTIAARDGSVKVYGIFDGRDSAEDAFESLQQARQISFGGSCSNRILIDGKPIEGMDERVFQETHPWKTVRNCDVNPKTLSPVCADAS